MWLTLSSIHLTGLRMAGNPKPNLALVLVVVKRTVYVHSSTMPINIGHVLSSTACWPRSCFAWQESKRPSVRWCSENGIRTALFFPRFISLRREALKLKLRRGCVDCQRKGKKSGLDCVAQELFQVNIHTSKETGQSSFMGRKEDGFNRHATKTHPRQWPAI